MNNVYRDYQTLNANNIEDIHMNAYKNMLSGGLGGNQGASIQTGTKGYPPWMKPFPGFLPPVGFN